MTLIKGVSMVLPVTTHFEMFTPNVGILLPFRQNAPSTYSKAFFNLPCGRKGAMQALIELGAVLGVFGGFEFDAQFLDRKLSITRNSQTLGCDKHSRYQLIVLAFTPYFLLFEIGSEAMALNCLCSQFSDFLPISIP